MVHRKVTNTMTQEGNSDKSQHDITGHGRSLISLNRAETHGLGLESCSFRKQQGLADPGRGLQLSGPPT